MMVKNAILLLSINELIFFTKNTDTGTDIDAPINNGKMNLKIK
ncbi:MAG: hypothetical protein V5A68_04185 [Candidatus Thermoplasmatota archaeon]